MTLKRFKTNALYPILVTQKIRNTVRTRTHLKISIIYSEKTAGGYLGKISLKHHRKRNENETTQTKTFVILYLNRIYKHKNYNHHFKSIRTI